MGYASGCGMCVPCSVYAYCHVVSHRQTLDFVALHSMLCHHTLFGREASGPLRTNGCRVPMRSVVQVILGEASAAERCGGARGHYLDWATSVHPRCSASLSLHLPQVSIRREGTHDRGRRDNLH